MSKAVIIFCVVASVFAIATLIYVVGSISSQRGERKNEQREHTAVCVEKALPSKTYAWLILGSLIGTAGGVLTAYATTKSHSSYNRNK